MEELCQQLPDNDPTQRALETTQRALQEVKGQIDAMYLKMQQHPDKWREWDHR